MRRFLSAIPAGRTGGLGLIPGPGMDGRRHAEAFHTRAIRARHRFFLACASPAYGLTAATIAFRSSREKTPPGRESTEERIRMAGKTAFPGLKPVRQSRRRERVYECRCQPAGSMWTKSAEQRI